MSYRYLFIGPKQETGFHETASVFPPAFAEPGFRSKCPKQTTHLAGLELAAVCRTDEFSENFGQEWSGGSIESAHSALKRFTRSQWNRVRISATSYKAGWFFDYGIFGGSIELGQLQSRLTDLNLVAEPKIAFGDSLPIDERPPATAGVIQSHSTVMFDDATVHARRRRILQLDMARLIPSDEHGNI